MDATNVDRGEHHAFGRDQLLIEPVIEVLPMNEYNAAEAKLKASVKWLLAQAFGNNLPDEFVDPFCVTANNQTHLRPALVNAMASGDIYAMAASCIFRDQSLLGQGLRAVLQCLQRHFGQLIDSDGNPVTEVLLRQTAPIRFQCHLAVIEQLMATLVKDLVCRQTVEGVCKKLGPIPDGDRAPDDAQGALLYWINKVCENVRNRVEMAAAVNGQTAPIIPEMDDVYEDICDGACLATIISYYRPDRLKFRDICFNDPMSLSDCIHNLWLVKEFCRHGLSCNVFHFSFEDVLYTHESMKPNLNVFLAELFHQLAGVLMLNERPVAVSSRRSVGIVVSQAVKPTVNCAPTVQREKPLTSRINSIDSLMIDQKTGGASLKKKNNKNGSAGLGARPLGTISFFDVPPSSSSSSSSSSSGAVCNDSGSPNVARRQPMAYGRSETMPCVNLYSTPSLIRMQLEEKRRLYEANRIKRHSELAEQRQKVSKAAFFQVRGKESEASPMRSAEQRQTMGAAAADPSSFRHSVCGFDELTKNIKEMQEQMKRLSVEQEKLQEMVKCRHESTILLPTTGGAVIDGHLLNAAQSLLCLPTTTLQLSNDKAPVARNGDEPTKAEENEAKEEAFHLHEENKQTLSRLDPSLDISKSMTDWGLTCTTATARRPRKTWDSLVATENGIDQADRTTSMYELCSGWKGEPPAATVDHCNSASSDNCHGGGHAVATGAPKVVAAVKAQQVQKERDSSPGIGFVVAAGEDANDDEQQLLRKKEQKLAAVLKRREEMELRRVKAEEESANKRAQMQRKAEEQERRRRERELKRQRVLEEYQRKRAEQEAAEANATISSSMISVGSQSCRRPLKSASPSTCGQFKSQVSLSSSRASPFNASSSSLMDLNAAMTDCANAGLSEPALKLFVKPVHKSNRTLVYNAIQYSVLVGAVNADVKSKVLEELAKSDSKHFLLLFRDQKCQYRGLYSWDQASDTVHKLHGVGPKFCSEAVMHQLFKYDSGSKQFSFIPSRHLSATIDAFTIKEELWQKKAGTTPRR